MDSLHYRDWGVVHGYTETVSARGDEEDPRPFDPWRFAKTERGRALVHDVLAAVDAYERASCPRERIRKATDQATLKTTLEAVICDVAHLHLSLSPESPQRIIISRSKAQLGSGPKRYRAPALNRQLPNVLDLLHATGFLEQQLGDRSEFALVFTDEFGEMRERRRTTIAPGPKLVAALGRHRFTFDDIGHSGGCEVIVLKAAREDYWQAPGAIDYVETAETLRLRAEVEQINRWLARAELTYIERHPGELRHIDLSERRLRRMFTCGDFSHGGRLAGAFWTNLDRTTRLSRLRICGERVSSLDFSSLYPRLLYAREGIRPAQADLYRIEGLEGYRDGVKKLLNARLFDVGPRTRKPKRSPEGVRAGVELFPPDRSIAELLDLLTTAHRPIAHHFGTGIGHELQFIESTIMVQALLRLEAAGVTALPVHDCVVVPRSKKDVARGILEEVSREIAGEVVPLSVEEIE